MKNFIQFTGYLFIIIILFFSIIIIFNPLNCKNNSVEFLANYYLKHEVLNNQGKLSQLKKIICIDNCNLGIDKLDLVPWLSNEQESGVASLGFDLNNLPKTITPQIKNCALIILGDERLGEIIDGASLLETELDKLENCY